jgi:hypothetical protein
MNATDEIDVLVLQFPRLFRGVRPMAHCFIPDQWFELVTKLFIDLDSMLNEADAAQFSVRQIKEKFNRLRVHWWLGPPRLRLDDNGREARDWYSPLLFDGIENRIRRAEDASERLPSAVQPLLESGAPLHG